MQISRKSWAIIMAVLLPPLTQVGLPGIKDAWFRLAFGDFGKGVSIYVAPHRPAIQPHLLCNGANRYSTLAQGDDLRGPI